MASGHRKIPFKLDLTQRNSLSEQMELALRQSIVSGHYQPGEVLPPIRAWAKMLGVSIRVPEAVIPKLVKEGLVIARPRHGCIVAPRGKSIFKGHVLLIVPPGDYVYNANIMCSRITRRLECAGYLVSRATLPTEGQDRSDLARLNIALRQSVDLAVLVYEHPAIARAAKALGVPFVWFGDHAPRNAIGTVVYSNEDAFAQFACACEARKIKRLEIVKKCYAPSETLPPVGALRNIKMQTMTVRIDEDALRPGSIVYGAMQAFTRRLAKSPSDLPDLFFFTDDHLFQGALPVLLKYGIRIPEQLRLATISNYGNGPVSPDPFDKIENNPIRNGDKVSDAILEYLETKHFPRVVTLTSQYIGG